MKSITFQDIKRIIIIVIGNYILAVAVGSFILPYDILSGGVAGLAIALKPIVPLDPKVIIDGLVIGMFVLGSLILGKRFAMTTALSSILYPVFLTFTRTMPAVGIDPLLASLYGGIIAGIGVGLTIKQGASTGGMDVPPLVLNKFTGIEIATWVFIIDGITVGLGFFNYGLQAVLQGFISVFAASYMIDRVLVFGETQAKMVYIISEQYEQILDIIHKKIDRGTTILQATGGYTGSPKPVIMTVVLKNQYPQLNALVTSIDPNAFLIVTDSTEVKGYGFSFQYKV
jgi:uncharacterized membrane-anchored protein YitT (DUF2179 family)